MKATPHRFFAGAGVFACACVLLGLAGVALEYYAAGRIRALESLPGRYGLAGLHFLPRPAAAGEQPIRIELDPFMLYRMVPNQDLGYCTVNEFGFRGAMPGAKMPGRTRVAVTGGSAVFGQGCDSDSETFCAQLAAGGKYEVINAGCIANLSGQELGCLAHYLLPHQPDIVVAFTGWNDLYARLWADIPHATDPGEPDLRNNYADYLRITDLHASPGRRYRAALGRCSPLLDYVRLSKARELPLDRDPQSLERRYIVLRDELLRNLRVMNSITRGSGARFLVVLQPELGTWEQKSAAEQEMWRAVCLGNAAYAEDFTVYYRRLLIELTADLARDRIAVYDGNALLAGESETCFRDFVHYTAAGHRRLAQRLPGLLSAAR